MKNIIFLALLILNCTLLFSQSGSNYKYKKSRIYHSIIVQPMEYSMKGSGDSIKVDIQFRIHHDELLFRTENNSQKAVLTYSISLRNDENIIIKRLTISDTLLSKASNTVNNYLYYFKNFTLILTNNNYNYEVEIDQPERSNIFSKKGKIDEFNGYRNSNGIGNPIFTYKFNDKLYASVLDSSLDYRAEGYCIFFPIYNLPEKQVKFNITSIPTSKNIGFNVNQKINFTNNAEIIDEVLYLTNNGDNEIQLITNVNSPIKYLKIDLSNNNLFPGNYLIRVINKNNAFSIDYLEQPYSLQYIDLAMKALSLIFSEKELKTLQNSDDRYKFIYDYFKPLDTNPKTVYNEAMNEYFRRVDNSIMNYSDFSENNGYMTARGRVYILYGMPDNIELENNPNYSIERWSFHKINKEFEFEIKNGLYRLLK